MEHALLVSNLALWIAVLILGVIVVALTRQLGVLHERVAPAGALAIGDGPAVGDVAPRLDALDLAGRSIPIGGPAEDGRSTLLFFLSPTCPLCEAVLPAVRSLARSEHTQLRVVLIGDGDRALHETYARARGLDELPLVVSPAIGLAHRVPKLPFAVLIDAAGVLRAKGLVNSREHLESLLEAQERGVGSMQDWLQGAAAPQGGV